jgi:hypothetical protein
MTRAAGIGIVLSAGAIGALFLGLHHAPPARSGFSIEMGSPCASDGKSGTLNCLLPDTGVEPCDWKQDGSFTLSGKSSDYCPVMRLPSGDWVRPCEISSVRLEGRYVDNAPFFVAVVIGDVYYEAAYQTQKLAEEAVDKIGKKVVSLCGRTT